MPGIRKVNIILSRLCHSSHQGSTTAKTASSLVGQKLAPTGLPAAGEHNLDYVNFAPSVSWRVFSLRTPGRGGGRRGPGCSGRVAPGPLPAPRRAEESGPQFPQFLYHGAATHSHSASRLASPAFSVCGLRASCRLTQLRCWVAPSPEVSCPASEPAHFLRSRSSVRLRRGHPRPLFLHTSEGVNPARSVPGSRDTAVPAVGADKVRLNRP